MKMFHWKTVLVEEPSEVIFGRRLCKIVKIIMKILQLESFDLLDVSQLYGVKKQWCFVWNILVMLVFVLVLGRHDRNIFFYMESREWRDRQSRSTLTVSWYSKKAQMDSRSIFSKRAISSIKYFLRLLARVV